ncbi:unnamed protein product, partial [Mesorhabditis belari]|uniref:Exocyst complex component Sec6 n=1 Tax=Mesorhabditis belari TaxID=2138241 RepID=A0AAF3EM38_9BILA
MSDDGEAFQAALKQVAEMFQRADQLEKLPELKKRADRKKTAVEAMLRTGVHSQLEGVRTAIQQLHTAHDDILTIEKELSTIRDRLGPFPALKARMSALRDANILHGQYAAAMENMKHIYNFNETVRAVEKAISNNKLLVAHKNIMDLELARDELLFELHKLGGSELDKQLLIKFFGEVDKLVKMLTENMWFVIGRALEMVKGNEIGNGPQELVTCLRIVEREERIDRYYVERQQNAGNNNPFMPPGRPRQWRKETFKVLEKTVWSRVEGMQIEDRDRNKSWLARYLEVIRVVVRDDLLTAKNAAQPCFPPEYQIFDRFVNMYHRAVSRRLRELANEELLKNELVQLLSWIGKYSGEDMLGNPRFKLNVAAILSDIPLLPKTTLKELHDQFIEMTRKDIKDWLRKTVDREKEDWYKHIRPEEDSNGYFYTQLPSILFGMIEDNVSICKEISTDLIPSVIHVNIEEFIGFSDHYRDAALAYKGKHFEDRNRFREYTSTMIAIANNLQTCIENTDKYMKHIRLLDGDVESASGVMSGRSTRKEVLINIDKLNGKWNDGILRSVNCLLEEVMADISKSLAELFSKIWLQSTAAIETICMTIHDYYGDHRHLRPFILLALMSELQYKVVAEYLKAVETKRLNFSNFDERDSAGKRLLTDAKKIQRVFDEMDFGDGSEVGNEDGNQIPSITRVLLQISSVISLRDKSLLSLEATTFARKFPDCGAEFLTALLASREDVGRSEAKALAEEVMSHVQFHPRDSTIQRLMDVARVTGGSAQTWSIPASRFAMGNVLQQFISRRD